MFRALMCVTAGIPAVRHELGLLLLEFSKHRHTWGAQLDRLVVADWPALDSFHREDQLAVEVSHHAI